jgi:sugar O-acyltransferase (sialic acid O-acetyltransferase NeuD family)
MPQPLVILGTGGSAFELLDIVDAINAIRPTWAPIGFLDDVRPPGSEYLGLEILGRLRDAPKFAGAGSAFVNAIGSDQSYRHRPEILASTGLAAGQFTTLVHPAASVSRRARLGRGVCVNFGVSIGGGATIGDHVTFSPGVIVGHDVVIEDFGCLAPGAIVSGFVHLGCGCYVGAGAVVRQKIRIGAQALIGMGAVVIRDVIAGTVVAGNPARVLRRSETNQP